MKNLRRLIYTSKATEEFTKRSLLDILHDSRTYNTIDKITGLLMHKDGYFLQIFEGEKVVVNDLFARLHNDPRHADIHMIQDSIVEKRLFSNWAMGCADFDDPELSFLPGIRNDLSNPKVVTDLLERLPEIASFFKEKID